MRVVSKLSDVSANQQISKSEDVSANQPGREGRRSLLKLLGPMSDPAKRSENAKVAGNLEIESGNQIKDRVTTRQGGERAGTNLPQLCILRVKVVSNATLLSLTIYYAYCKQGQSLQFPTSSLVSHGSIKNSCRSKQKQEEEKRQICS